MLLGRFDTGPKGVVCWLSEIQRGAFYLVTKSVAQSYLNFYYIFLHDFVLEHEFSLFIWGDNAKFPIATHLHCVCCSWVPLKVKKNCSVNQRFEQRSLTTQHFRGCWYASTDVQAQNKKRRSAVAPVLGGLKVVLASPFRFEPTQYLAVCVVCEAAWRHVTAKCASRSLWPPLNVSHRGKFKSFWVFMASAADFREKREGSCMRGAILYHFYHRTTLCPFARHLVIKNKLRLSVEASGGVWGNGWLAIHCIIIYFLICVIKG